MASDTEKTLTRARLRSLVRKHRSYRAAARAAGMSYEWFRRQAKRHQVEPPAPRRKPPKVCVQCGADLGYLPAWLAKRRKFCGQACAKESTRRAA